MAEIYWNCWVRLSNILYPHGCGCGPWDPYCGSSRFRMVNMSCKDGLGEPEDVIIMAPAEANWTLCWMKTNVLGCFPSPQSCLHRCIFPGSWSTNHVSLRILADPDDEDVQDAIKSMEASKPRLILAPVADRQDSWDIMRFCQNR